MSTDYQRLQRKLRSGFGRARKVALASRPSCEDCGASGREAPLEVHHKLEVALGGTHAQSNLLVLCRRCHKARHPPGWLAKARKAAEAMDLKALSDAERTGELEQYAEAVWSTEPVPDLQDDDTYRREVVRQLKAAIGQLTPREQGVIERRYGFDGGWGRSLEEIAEEQGVSHFRIRQIEAKGLRRMRRQMGVVSRRLREIHRHG